MSQPLRENAHHLYMDVFWYGILAGSAIAFLPVYAARVGATAFLVGLLTSGPAVVNLLGSMPAGRWLEHHSVIRAAYRTALLNRAGFLTLIFLPALLPAAYQVWAIPLLILIMAAPGTLLAIAFNALFADVVPPEWRSHVVGRRNALLAISLTATSLMCGLLLDRIAFPLNYQIIFGLGALGAAMSAYHLGRIRALNGPPPRVGRPMGDVAASGQMRFADTLRQAPGLRFLTRAGSSRILRLDLLRGPFGPFLGAYFLFYTFQYVPIPIVPLFWVNELHLSDGAISWGSAIFYLVMLVFSVRLARLSERLGHHRVLTLGALLYGLYPLFTGLAHDATLYWVASLIGGGVWAFTNGGLVSRLMERVPAGDRPAHMALHNLVLNLGILSGSALGPLLGSWIGLRETLLLAAGLRFLGGIALGLWG